ncbi:MAG: DUF362 domain-containing protein [Coriobacteriia bacterium]
MRFGILRAIMSALKWMYGSLQGRNHTMSLPVVDNNSCTACGICVDECPQSCYDLEDVAVLSRADDCTECGICVDSCPNGAISMP